jgi:mono/diheme cytochrome c family protein
VSGTYASAVAASSSIELYASRDATAAYRAIAPEASGSRASVPEGGVIVREVLDASGTAQRLTVMAKGPAGYEPILGDWFFAVTDLAGVPAVENGQARAGRLVDCYGCHTPRAADDYLFGVPLDQRGSGSAPPPQGSGTTVCGDFTCDGGETHAICPQDCNHGHDR